MQVTTRPPARTLIADGVFAAVVTAFMAVGTRFAAMGDVPPRHPLDAWVFVLVGVAGIGVLLRRVRPLVGLGAAVGATAAYLVTGYPYGPILFSVVITLYSMATRLPVRRSLPALAVAAAAVSTAFGVHAGWGSPLTVLTQLAIPLGWSLTVWAIGTVVRTARESTQRTRAEHARRRSYEERLRTAQDVHDIVGHGLAAISMQAGVALHVLDRSPGQAREILEAIRESSQDALDELRATLAVFRAPHGVDPDGGERAPSPGLERLEVLVNRTTDSGVPVELIRTGERAHLPASVDLAAYRIVQESLTNVLRHAGPATATVHVTYREDEVTLEITDTGRGPDGHAETGLGLTGMRARAGAVGGTVDAGPGPAGGFVVRARLPIAGQAR
ncbi:MAG: sensor histidine kinase [Pseudonocardiaceae bacterium]